MRKRSEAAGHPKGQIVGRAPDELIAFEKALVKRPTLTWGAWQWEWAIGLARKGRPRTLAQLLRGCVEAPPPTEAARTWLADFIEGVPGTVLKVGGRPSAITESEALAIRGLYASFADQFPQDTYAERIARLVKTFAPIKKGVIRNVVDGRHKLAKYP